MTEPEIQLLAGAIIGGVALLWNKISVGGKAAYSWLVSSSTRKVPTTLESTDTNVHDVLRALINERKKAKDDAGVLLLTAVGKHLYDFENDGGKDATS
mgnify:CR=1 FL=1